MGSVRGARMDVSLQRPPGHRNEVWESDHVEAPVEVDVEGRLLKPWVTWSPPTWCAARR
jgi:putative transposase